MPHDDPSGPPPYNPDGADDLTPRTKDFQTAVEHVEAAIHAQTHCFGNGDVDEAKRYAAEAVSHAADMARHLRQELLQSQADGTTS